MISLYTYTNHVSIVFCFSFHCCIANGICFYWKSIFRILLKGIQVGSANSKSANANNNSPGLAQPIYTYLHQKNPRRSSAYIYCYSIPIRFSVSTSSHSKENGGASTLEEDREEEGEEVQEASE